VPVGATPAQPADTAAIPAAPAVEAPAVPAAPAIVQAPAAPAAPTAVHAPAAPAKARPAVKAVPAKAPAHQGLADTAYAARLQADLCMARQIFCGLDHNGRYPAH
jgi:2-oxoglutarate dehydrogenase E2 component (dihydrolipoamide succinyltransferase)